MPDFKTPLEIYKLLEKSNCGLCVMPSCMAFAAAVFKGEKRLSDCPRCDAEASDTAGGPSEARRNVEEEQERIFSDLKDRMRQVDLAAAAARIGATLTGGRLVVKCLGKDFLVDSAGNLQSECHINRWVHAPLLNYVIGSAGREIAGEWVKFKELEKGMEWDNFFSRRCVEPLKQIMDHRTGLFFDIMEMFDARRMTGAIAGDHAVMLLPFPKVPFLINYWEAEDDLDSKLDLFFDRTATENINLESIYMIGTGFAEMVKKIIHTHASG